MLRTVARNMRNAGVLKHMQLLYCHHRGRGSFVVPPPVVVAGVSPSRAPTLLAVPHTILSLPPFFLPTSRWTACEKTAHPMCEVFGSDILSCTSYAGAFRFPEGVVGTSVFSAHTASCVSPSAVPADAARTGVCLHGHRLVHRERLGVCGAVWISLGISICCKCQVQKKKQKVSLLFFVEELYYWRPGRIL